MIYLTTHIRDRIDHIAARLAVSMQLPSSAQERARMIVVGAFLAVWAQERPDEVKTLVSSIGGLAPQK